MPIPLDKEEMAALILEESPQMLRHLPCAWWARALGIEGDPVSALAQRVMRAVLDDAWQRRAGRALRIALYRSAVIAAWNPALRTVGVNPTSVATALTLVATRCARMGIPIIDQAGHDEPFVEEAHWRMVLESGRLTSAAHAPKWRAQTLSRPIICRLACRLPQVEATWDDASHLPAAYAAIEVAAFRVLAEGAAEPPDMAPLTIAPATPSTNPAFQRVADLLVRVKAQFLTLSYDTSEYASADSAKWAIAGADREITREVSPDIEFFELRRLYVDVLIALGITPQASDVTYMHPRGPLNEHEVVLLWLARYGPTKRRRRGFFGLGHSWDRLACAPPLPRVISRVFGSDRAPHQAEAFIDACRLVREASARATPTGMSPCATIDQLTKVLLMSHSNPSAGDARLLGEILSAVGLASPPSPVDALRQHAQSIARRKDLQKLLSWLMEEYVSRRTAIDTPFNGNRVNQALGKGRATLRAFMLRHVLITLARSL